MPQRDGYAQLGHLLPEGLVKRFFALAERNGHSQTDALDVALQMYLGAEWPERPAPKPSGVIPEPTRRKRGRPKKGK